MRGYRARMRCSSSLSTRRSWAARATSSATSFGWPDSAIAGAPASETGAGFLAPNGSASIGVMGTGMVPSARKVDQTTSRRLLGLRGARLERVELYFCDLNEVDASEVSARRTKVHGSEAMNAVFSGAQLAVTRFEDTKLYRARFDQALLVRVVFLDSRMGGPSLEKADFSGARLVDVSLRAANLQGASFAGATLVGVDFTDAALEGADFRGAVAIGCRFPAGFSP